MNKLPKSKLPQMENYRSEIYCSSLCSKNSLEKKRNPKTESVEIQSVRVFRMVYLLTRNLIITIALLRIIWITEYGISIIYGIIYCI